MREANNNHYLECNNIYCPIIKAQKKKKHTVKLIQQIGNQ